MTMMENIDFVQIMVNQGFAIAVAVYLLVERRLFNEKIVGHLEKIAIIIDERIPKKEA
jgi:hypothetical protein